MQFAPGTIGTILYNCTFVPTGGKKVFDGTKKTIYGRVHAIWLFVPKHAALVFTGFLVKSGNRRVVRLYR